MSAALLAQLLRQAGLADPRLADQLDERAEAHPHRRHRGAEHGALALAVDERAASVLAPGAASRSAPSANARTGALLPLTTNGSSSVASNRPSVRSRRSRRDEDLPRLRPRHQPRGECRRVAEHRVRAPEGRADLTGEDAAAARAGVDGQRRVAVDDRAQRPQEPLLVVPGGLRRARDEHDAAAVPVDVALEERDAVPVGGALQAADELVERVGGRLRRPRVLDQRVRAREAHEADRGVTVLALERPDPSSCARRGAGTAFSSGMPVDVGQRLDGAARVRLARRSTPAPLRLAE